MFIKHFYVVGSELSPGNMETKGLVHLGNMETKGLVHLGNMETKGLVHLGNMRTKTFFVSSKGTDKIIRNTEESAITIE